MTDKLVDYYAILEVKPTSTPEQIRTAYKKAALKWHPDRVSSDSPERLTRTKKFQQINDAYFTLSDPSRRRDYDAARQWNSPDTHSEYDADDYADSEIPRPSPKKGGFGSWFPFGFGGDSTSQSAGSGGGFQDSQWSSAFEEMMRETGMGEERTQEGTKATRPTGRFWMLVGGISGFGLGTIVGNIPGGLAGAVAGSKLGSIRDTHGKSVYQVFQELPQADKAKVLSELAAKIFAQAVSG